MPVDSVRIQRSFLVARTALWATLPSNIEIRRLKRNTSRIPIRRLVTRFGGITFLPRPDSLVVGIPVSLLFYLPLYPLPSIPARPR